MEKTYIEEYTEFIRDYKTGEVSAEVTGEVIARLAQRFSEYNMKLVDAERALFIVAKDVEMRQDEVSGKTITSAKAEAIIKATEEHYKADQLRAHVQNIEQFISALKALQKGQTNEYSHQSFS